ncbi:HSP90 family protein [Mycetocola reblochoni]|uniref:Chaperone protein HtpG n=2 Tax=Mycetocola reblochoni TaxID=331618 RepID=A0A1R4J294_9MICO|nr:HSP90 family protein [Mycetocola reblochoni]RLP71211.1 HSP90 family protein [Mycetocola reblochoni]SJN25783.1 Chaperone protein HtpG [Mycetocola reblochoni REB411]
MSPSAPSADDAESRPFHVDLGGVIALLSRHIYSTPAVYLRELLQNAVDAGSARRRADPEAPATEVRIRPADDGDELIVSDNGVGLSAEEAAELLATVGRSSKSGELYTPGADGYLGRFGIGLLSCFLIADRIVVRSRSAHGHPPIEWTGSIDGSFRIRELPEDADVPVGTEVRLVPRPQDAAVAVRPGVARLAREYGQYLPVSVGIVEPDGSRTRINRDPVFAREDAGDRELAEFGRELIGRAPLDVIRLSVPGTGTRGVAVVLPAAPPPGARQASTVYLRGMLLSDRVDELLPEWAFFVRVVVDSEDLTPTASREQLVGGTSLEFTRDQIAEALRNWILLQARTRPHRLAEFVSVHHLALKAVAVHDDELAAIIIPLLSVSTSQGQMSIEQLLAGTDTVRYAASLDEFRQLAPVSQADVPLINAGFVYEEELLRRLPLLRDGVSVERATVGGVVDSFDVAPLDDRPVTTALEERAGAALADADCRVTVRLFQPDDVPALYVSDPAVIRRINRGAAGTVAPGPWSGVIGRIDALVEGAAGQGTAESRAQLCLNWSSPLVRRLAKLGDELVFARSVRLLYLQSMLAGHRPLGRSDRVILNETIGDLVQLSVGAEELDDTALDRLGREADGEEDTPA